MVPSFYFTYQNELVSVEKIKALLEKKFQEEEFNDCFLVEATLNNANSKLEVFIDSDSGMTFKKCQHISRFLEQYIDEAAWLGEKYILEVSSPGIDRPLKFVRQYHRNIGRTLEVNLMDGTTQKGKLVACDDQKITLEKMVTKKQGKKKKKELVQTEVAFENIAQTKVKITF